MYIPSIAPSGLETDGLRSWVEEEFRNIARVWGADDVVSDIESYLLGVPAWKHGVPGATVAESTTNLQALVDAAHAAGGGIILLRGTTRVTGLDMSFKNNVTLIGQGINATFLYLDGGAVGPTTKLLDMWGASRCHFKSMRIQNDNTNFDGIMIGMGDVAATPLVDCPLNSFQDCFLVTVPNTSSTSITLLASGATAFHMQDCAITSQAAVPIQLSDAPWAGFATAHALLRCKFLCWEYAIQGGVAGMDLIDCVFQTAPSGKGVAYLGPIDYKSYNIRFQACSFISDQAITQPTFPWIKVQKCRALAIEGCSFTGAVNNCVELGGGTDVDIGWAGVMGWTFVANDVRGPLCAINFVGNPAVIPGGPGSPPVPPPSGFTAAKDGWVTSNALILSATLLFDNLANCHSMAWGFNTFFNYAAGAAIRGSTPGYYGLPTSVTGVNGVWNDSGTLKIG